MSSIEAYLRQLAEKGSVRVHLWQVHGGGFQANVAEPANRAWTVVHDDDPVGAVREALRQRACGINTRTVEASDGYVDAPAVQIDLEEAIAAASDHFPGQTSALRIDGRVVPMDRSEPPVDEFEGLLG